MAKYKIPEEGIYDARPLGKGRMFLLGFQHMFAMFGNYLKFETITLMGISGKTVMMSILIFGYFLQK